MLICIKRDATFKWQPARFRFVGRKVAAPTGVNHNCSGSWLLLTHPCLFSYFPWLFRLACLVLCARVRTSFATVSVVWRVSPPSDCCRFLLRSAKGRLSLQSRLCSPASLLATGNSAKGEPWPRANHTRRETAPPPLLPVPAASGY